MYRDLRLARILVTGASRGIGRQIAEKAARMGARVILTARSESLLTEVVAQLRASGCDAQCKVADITRGEDRQALVDFARSELGGLDVLINNAGVCSFGHFIGGTEEVLRQVMEVNFFAPAELIRACFPLLKEGKLPAVVNIASKCGRRALPAFPEYSASKYALVGLSESLRTEWVIHKISVLVVLPGLTRSELGEHLLRNEGKMKLPFEEGMPVERVARDTLDALVRNRSETVLGWDARWILWMQRLAPWFVDYVIARRVRRLYAQ
jgi:short-subunit dehydrogenase